MPSWLVFSFLVIFGSGGCTLKSKEIKIGIYATYKGDVGVMGASMRNGVRLAVDEINAEGGILGRKVVVVDRETELSEEIGVKVIQELLYKEKVIAVLGPFTSRVADATTKYVNQRKIPQIINLSAGAKVNELFKVSPDNYVFRLSASDDTQVKFMVQEALKRGARRPALLCHDTFNGQHAREKMEETLVIHGMSAVYTGKFKPFDANLTEQIKAAKAAKADVILTYGYGEDLEALVNSMSAAKWKVDMIATWTVALPNVIKKAGLNSHRVMMPQTFIETDLRSEKQKQFLQTYKAKFQDPPVFSASAAAQGYDSMYLLKGAILQANSFEGKKIKDALETLKKPYDGVIDTFATPFSAADHEGIKVSSLRMGMIKNGEIVLADELKVPAVK